MFKKLKKANIKKETIETISVSNIFSNTTIC